MKRWIFENGELVLVGKKHPLYYLGISQREMQFNGKEDSREKLVKRIATHKLEMEGAIAGFAFFLNG